MAAVMRDEQYLVERARQLRDKDPYQSKVVIRVGELLRSFFKISTNEKALHH